jgi:hypothetical protein
MLQQLTDRVPALVASTPLTQPEALRVLLLAQSAGWTYEEVCLLLKHETQAHTDAWSLADAVSLWIAAGVRPGLYSDDEA